QKIEIFRNTDIFALSNFDQVDIRDLFNDFLRALQNSKGIKSPVSVSVFLYGIKTYQKPINVTIISIMLQINMYIFVI
ncbi:MAG: hypothetical protein ACXADY_15055, partial [Candidatus Hodarchaeales archaeon]